jgi:hypothetical protein
MNSVSCIHPQARPGRRERSFRRFGRHWAECISQLRSESLESWPMENNPISSDGSDQPVVDVLNILRTFGVLKQDSADELPDDHSAADHFLTLMKNSTNVADCVTQLFPSGIPVGQLFFDLLDDFHRWIGIHESGDEAIGLIWSEAMRRLTPNRQQDLLGVFVNQKGHDFFEHVGCLPTVLQSIQLPSSFLSSWFPDLYRAVANDVQTSVWEAIRTVCIHQSEIAIAALELLLERTEDRQLTVAAFMLGTLRTLGLTEEQASALAQIENLVASHADIRCREVFNRSWVTTASGTGLTADQMRGLYSRAELSENDLSSIVGVICHLVSFSMLPEDQALLAREWLSKAVIRALSSEAKHSVAAAADRLSRDPKQMPPEVTDWILAILPVTEDNPGTWERIGSFLSHLLRKDGNQFTDVALKICRTSAITILRLLHGGRFRHLMHDFKKHDISDLASQLALSVDTSSRKLGVYLFDQLDIDELSAEALRNSPPVVPRLLFYEMQRIILKPTTIARLLAGLEPIAEESTDWFKSAFFDELKLQCHNFSGGCRHEIEALSKNRPMVAQALEDVAGYFDSLKHAHDAGINAMEVAGFRRAATLQKQLFNKRVSDHGDSASPLVSLFKKVSLLYGRAASQFIESKLSNAMPLGQMTTSMELPMVDFCDPEEMALRRLHASAAIAALIKEHTGHSGDEDE